MIDELEVQTRHKRKLASIREQDDSRDELSRGYPEVAGERLLGTQGSDEGSHGATGPGEEGVPSGEGNHGGHGEGIRPSDIASVPSDQSPDHRSGAPGEHQLIPDLSPEEKRERERLLARDRKARQRDRQKEAAALTDDPFLSVERDRDQSSRDAGNVTPIGDGSRFALKNPLSKLAASQEKVKLFTEKEAKEVKENMTFIYLKGSGLLDDILEVIVRGHEKVQIWQLDEGEAEMLADMHLERAKKSVEAARSARVLLSIYDRLFTIMLVAPRMMATGRHVKDHGGLSFR